VNEHPPDPETPALLQGLLGYLNFSEGKPDARFQQQLSTAFASLAGQGERDPCGRLGEMLRSRLDQLKAAPAGAFQDAGQAEAVLDLVFRRLLPAYREFHADLLFHQTDADLFQPFFLARAFEAVLSQGPPWSQQDRVVSGALKRLNDFVGHRPVAILENRPRGEPYDHERVRPIPLYIRGAGTAGGRYARLVDQALQTLADTSPDLRAEAYLDLDLLDELALDPRAYDDNHPVNKRTNYIFGEWDPHHLDNQGRYRRYVVRQLTLDALLDRVEHPGEVLADEALFEAGVVLAGTMLMATGVSGAGPETHDSSVTLHKLMPRIARYRDAFYAQQLDRLSGAHAARLRQEATVARQPFGGARQHLNQYLARHRATLLQQRHLALIMADMGYPDASRRHAALIPAASVRMLSEIHTRLATGLRDVEEGELERAARAAAAAEDFLRRGIACGALADPWNILGFQGQFPLSAALEDSVRDGRIDELVEVVERLLNLYARVEGEAGARGDRALIKTARAGLKRLADWWDRFASFEVSGVRRVHGGEAAASARHVADTLLEWHERGEAAADLAFWREHLGGFQSPKAFALVLDALLRKEDFRAAMALLVNWLGQADQAGLEEAEYSFHALAVRWVLSVNNPGAKEADPHDPSPEAEGREAERWALKKKFLDYLEANAEEFWQVPALGSGGAEELPMPEEEEDVYGAAYEGVTYKDSTDDGEEGEVMEGGRTKEFDLEAEGEGLVKRLRFLATVARLWHLASWRHPEAARLRPAPAGWGETLGAWLGSARSNQHALLKLMDALHAHTIPEPGGDYDSMVAFDRHRQIKEQLVFAAVTTCLYTTLAIGTLEAALADSPFPPPPDPGRPAFAAALIRLERALYRGDPAAAREALPEFTEHFRQEPLVFQHLAAGGHPRQVWRAGVAQGVLRALLANLPRLGLVRESFDLLLTARAMEQAARQAGPGGERVVPVFHQLFETALPAVAEAVVDSATTWGPAGADGGELAQRLNGVVQPFLNLWIDHSKTLPLSPLEAIPSENDWQGLRQFIRRYGGDLFHARFLTQANLRGILHRGVGAYLDHLAENPDPLHPVRLLDDLDRAIPRRAAENFLALVLAAVVENYEEYKDFNSTTTQSDYGENLYLLLDFLRVKVHYERQAWNYRPLVLVHDVLVRQGKRETARVWQLEFARFTEAVAARHLAELAALETAHGMRLGTVADRLGEKFVRPLALDLLCALVEPSMEEARRGQGTGSFEQFERELEPYAAHPAGVGLDVPHWLRRLEAEVGRVRLSWTAIAGLATALVQVPRTPLSLADLEAQLRDGENPAEEGKDV
jgi:hypothetical protein